MRDVIHKAIAVGLCELLVFLPITGDARRQPFTPPVQTTALREYLQKSYLELFELVPKLGFTAEEIQNQRRSFDKGKDLCVMRFKDHAVQTMTALHQ